MARTVLSLAILACLGLALLHLVSAEEQNQELEEKAINRAVIQANPEEQQIRTAREADADAKRKRHRNKKNGEAKGSGKKRCQNGKKGCKRKQRKMKGIKDTSGCKKGPKGRSCRRKNARKARKGSTGRKGGKDGKTRKSKRKGSGSGRRPKKCKDGKCKKRNGGRSKGKQDKTKESEKSKKAEVRQGACDEKALCQKIKDYIKYSNQLRKLRRINKTCSTMEKKRDKAGGGEFSASGEANDASDNSTVQEIADKLKNCTSTAKAKCETKAIPACTNLTLNNKCETELDAWIKKFGPAKGSCLQASASCCACITAISPSPSADCLNFDPLDIASKAKKKKCTGSSEEGSFGHCRKLQMEAAEKGPKAHKEKCKGKGDMTTAKSSGRRNIFRSNLMKKFIKT